jgi:hypothetical protein
MVSKLRIAEDLATKPVRKPSKSARVLDPEEALERQIRQIERNFGPDWKW